MSPDQNLKFWHGLINSGIPFLWVTRQDLIFDDGPNVLRKEIEFQTNEGAIS